MKVTPRKELDAALERLGKGMTIWAQMLLADRIAFIDRIQTDLLAGVEEWVAKSAQAKEAAGAQGVAAQEWLSGPYLVMRNLRLLRRSLVEIRDTGKPVPPGPVQVRENGQVVVRVFPADRYDALFFKGTTGEIWMQPEVSQAELAETTAVAYSRPTEGAICLVLGGGNVSSIGPMDCFYKLFIEKKVTLLKMHPVNEYLGPIFSRAFAALIEGGFLEIVYGSAEEGTYLCSHDDVDEIHITGSDKTHDLIVFGSDVAEAKAARRPVLNKPITSELGNVSPVIVVPGPWSAKDIAFQAENLVSSLVINAGFNCNASRVIITHRDWPARPAFLEALRHRLAAVETRTAYYPGAADRFDTFAAAHPQAHRFGEREGGRLPWMLIEDLDADTDDICFRVEAFCGLFGELPLTAADTADFLKKAVDFANDKLWGTLNATLLAHPSCPRGLLERAIADLRYGTIAINHWAAVGYGLCTTSWGAFPGHDLYDIQSGSGVVHNTGMFDKIQKSVVRGPFRTKPKPPWFVGHKNAELIGRRLTGFEAKPGLLKLPGIILPSLFG